GGFGGFIAGSESFIARIRGASHYYDGASAPPAPIAAASARALALIAEDPTVRLRLRSNVERLQTGLRTLGLEVPNTPTAQVGVAIGTSANMQRLHTA